MQPLVSLSKPPIPQSRPWTPALHPSAPETVSQGSYWLWKADAAGYAPYKNDVLRKYQDALMACGIPQSELRLFVQQVTQENGALDPATTGGTDHGYSFGIGQWNHSPTKATTWLNRHPEQRTLEWQIAALAQGSCDRYHEYDGDVRRVITAHNCPSCARSNNRPSRCGGIDSLRVVGRKWSCYFDDEVDSPEHAALFSQQ